MFSMCRYSQRIVRCTLVVYLAYSTLIIGSGCAAQVVDRSASERAEFLSGRDSAGAAIEIEMSGGDFVSARVIDTVLGEAEAEVTIHYSGQVEFTAHFPAGARIKYVGERTVHDGSKISTLSGTWRQLPSGVFGDDFGTWEVL